MRLSYSDCTMSNWPSKSLEEASRLDPDSIQADFLMGIVYGTISKNDKKAQVHFEKCLKREPGNVSALNNLAVSLANQKKYPEAARHWKTAAASAPNMRELSQNIGSLITMAGTKQAKLPPRTLQDLSQIYDELITKHGNPRPSQMRSCTRRAMVPSLAARRQKAMVALSANRSS